MDSEETFIKCSLFSTIIALAVIAGAGVWWVASASQATRDAKREARIACVQACRPNVAMPLIESSECQCDMTKEYR